MLHNPPYNKSEHWRARAEEILAIAEEMKDVHAKAIMHDIAEDYLRLAERAQMLARRTNRKLFSS